MATGGCAGLALSSKYSAVLTLVGVAAFLATEPGGRRWLRRPHPYLAGLIALQRRLLERAIGLTRPGGAIVYCTCSLEPEEGEEVVAGVLANHGEVRQVPISPSEVNDLTEFIKPAGQLRTLPCGWPDPDPLMAGLDGFFAARLERL